MKADGGVHGVPPCQGMAIVVGQGVVVGIAVNHGNRQRFAGGGDQAGTKVEHSDGRMSGIAHGEGRSPTRTLDQPSLADLQARRAHRTAVQEKVSIDSRQRAARHGARFLQVGSLHRAQTHSVLPGQPQIELNHVNRPRAVDDIDGVMVDADGELFRPCGNTRPARQCRRATDHGKHKRGQTAAAMAARQACTISR